MFLLDLTGEVVPLCLWAQSSVLRALSSPRPRRGQWELPSTGLPKWLYLQEQPELSKLPMERLSQRASASAPRWLSQARRVWQSVGS